MTSRTGPTELNRQIAAGTIAAIQHSVSQEADFVGERLAQLVGLQLKAMIQFADLGIFCPLLHCDPRQPDFMQPEDEDFHDWLSNFLSAGSFQGVVSDASSSLCRVDAGLGAKTHGQLGFAEPSLSSFRHWQDEESSGPPPWEDTPVVGDPSDLARYVHRHPDAGCTALSTCCSAQFSAGSDEIVAATCCQKRKNLTFDFEVSFWFPSESQLFLGSKPSVPVCGRSGTLLSCLRASSARHSASHLSGGQHVPRCLGPDGCLPGPSAASTLASQARSTDQVHLASGSFSRVGSSPDSEVVIAASRLCQPYFSASLLQQRVFSPGTSPLRALGCSFVKPDSAAPSMSGVEHTDSVRSGRCLDAATFDRVLACHAFCAAAYCVSPPILCFPRHRRHRNRQAILHGTDRAVTTRPVLNSVPGMASYDGASTSVASAASPLEEARRPYTAFDEVSCSRTLHAYPSWDIGQHVRHAIATSRLPGRPIGRPLQFQVAGFAVPQVAVTQDRRFSARRAAVFDLRGIGLEVEALDVIPSHSVAQSLAMLRTLHEVDEVLHRLRTGSLRCRVNAEVVPHEAPIGGGVDVVVLEVTSVAWHQPRPPTPPIPEPTEMDADPTPAWTDPLVLSEDSQPTPPVPRRWQKQLGRGLALTLTAKSEIPACTIFDPKRHVEVVTHTSCHHPGALLVHALTTRKDFGTEIDGRVLMFPLPEWPRPQVCVHSLVFGSHVVVPVALGHKVCTISVLREASIFELMLNLEGRCNVPRAYRHLVARGWVDVYVNNQRVVDIFERDSLLFADSVRVAAVPALETSNAPDILFPEPRYPPRPDAFLTVHRPGLAPVQHYIHPFSTPEVMRMELRAQGLLSKDGAVQFPLVSPVLVDGGAHLISLSSAQVDSETCFMVMDLRRVVHPPFVTFWTTPAVTQFDVGHIEDLLLCEFPSVSPVVNVFVDDIRADVVTLARRFPLVTVMGVPSDPRHLGRLPQPALDYTQDLLLARPGQRSRSMRFSCALRPPPPLLAFPTSTTTTTGMQGPMATTEAASSSGPTLPVAARRVTSASGPSRHSPQEDNWQHQYFTVFDADMQVRFLERKPGWTTADCIREARRLSRHLATPHRVAVLSHALAQLPVPQVVLSPHQLLSSSRAVVCDFRPLGLGIRVLDLSFGNSLFEGLTRERQRAGCSQALTRLTQGAAGVSIGGAMGDVFRQIPVDIASVHAFAWDHPRYPMPEAGSQLARSGSANDDRLRSLSEVASEIADPPWFRMTFHLPTSGSTEEPVALFTQAPTASTLQSLTQLASEHISLFRPHQWVRLHFPAFTPVGSGSLLHVIALCDDVDQADSTVALFDGRELDARIPAVYSAFIPKPSTVCELAAAARVLWPDRPAAASFLVNGDNVVSLEDVDRAFPLVQPIPRVALPVGTRPPPFRPVPTEEILDRLPGLSPAVLQHPTSTSTTTLPAGLPGLTGRVWIAFAFPGARPRAVQLQHGFHFADALWDLVSDPNPAVSLADVHYWEVVASPRLFPERSGGHLVLLTISTLDPFSEYVWIDLRLDQPVLMVAEVGIGRSRAELIDRFCSGRTDILLYVDGALAGDVPAFRPGSVFTFCRKTWECSTLPLTSLFAQHPSLRILQFPFGLPTAARDLARARLALRHTALPVCFSKFRADFMARLAAEFETRLCWFGPRPHQAAITFCSPSFGTCTTSVGLPVAPPAHLLRSYVQHAWPDLRDCRIIDTQEFFEESFYYCLADRDQPLVAWIRAQGAHDDVLFLPPTIHPTEGLPCPADAHIHVYRHEGSWGLFATGPGASSEAIPPTFAIQAIDALEEASSPSSPDTLTSAETASSSLLSDVEVVPGPCASITTEVSAQRTAMEAEPTPDESLSLIQTKASVLCSTQRSPSSTLRAVATPCRRRPTPLPAASAKLCAPAPGSESLVDMPVLSQPTAASVLPEEQTGDVPTPVHEALAALAWASVIGHGTSSVTFPISIAGAIAPPVETLPGYAMTDVAQLCVTLQRTFSGRQFMVPHPILDGLRLHPSTARNLPRLGSPIQDIGSLPLGTVAHLYTDGSRGPEGSGWSVVVLLALPSGRWHFQGVLAAPSSAAVFHERLHTSDEAESAALAAAISWCASMPGHVSAVIHVDCDAARHFATGAWTLPPARHDHPCTAAVSRALFILLESLGRAPWVVAVRGHSHHPWNELADVAAKAASAACGNATDFCWPDWLALLRSPLLPWLWLLPSSSWHYSLPPLMHLATQQHFVQPPRSRQAGRSLSAVYCLDPMKSQAVTLQLRFRCASLNALTLRETRVEQVRQSSNLLAPAMQELMQDQCDAAGLTLVGLQETRLPKSASFASTKYFVMSAACDKAGQGGCALWVNRHRPYGHAADGAPLFLQRKHLFVVMADPQLLFVRLQAPGLQLLVVVGHGPHSRRSEEERVAWWGRLHSLTASFIKPSEHLMLLVDANARVGSVQSPSVGPDGAEKQTHNGALLHSFLSAWQLCLPCTLGKHEGSQATWQSPLLTQARIDFIAVPLAWLEQVASTWVDYDFEFGQVRSDHWMTCLEVGWAQVSLGSGHIRKPFRPGLPDPAFAPFWSQRLANMPPIAWKEDVDSHAHLLTKSHQSLMRQCHQPPSLVPRQPFVTQEALLLVRFRRSVRLQLRALKARSRRTFLLAFFHLWKSQHWLGIDLHLCNLQEACAARVLMLTASELKSCLKAGKKAYLLQLSRTFSQEARGRNWQELWKALSCLRPNQGKKRRLNPLLSVRAADGAVLQGHEEVSARWSQHFAEIEGGHVSSIADLAAEQASSPAAFSVSLHELPTRLQWESTFRGIKSKKAPGPDGVTTDFVKQDVATFAATSFPLCLKAAYTTHEPLRWRGGTAFPLWKGKQSEQLCSSYRSILVSELLSKRFHAWLRHDLLKVFAGHKTAGQCGITGGSTCSMLSLWIRSAQRYLTDAKRSHGILFTDIQSAFYSTLRQFVTGTTNVHAFLQWCREKGIHEDGLDVIVATLHTDVAQLSAHLTCLQLQRLRDVLHNTWFLVPGMELPVSTERGTRPGDPLADLIYGLVMAGALREIEAGMCEASLAPEVTLAGVLPGHLPGDVPCAPSIAWHDDAAFAFVGSTARSLRTAAATTARVVWSAFHCRGLSLSFAPDKSEVLLSPQGKGSDQVRKQLFSVAQPCIFFLPDIGCMRRVSIVRTYVHLGSVIDASMNLLPDIRRRLCLATEAAKPLSRAVFRNLSVPLEVRAILFRSLVLSRLTHNVGSWAGLTLSEQAAWQKGCMRLYRFLVPAKAAADHIDCARLCSMTLMPAPLQLIKLERLRLLNQCAIKGFSSLLQLVEGTVGSSHCWLTEALEDVRWLVELRPVPSALALQDLDVAELFKALQARPSGLAHLLPAAWSRVVHNVEVKDFMKFADSARTSLKCLLCGKDCKGRQGLQVHMSRRHGELIQARFYAPDHRCHACKKCFATRERVIKHLSRRSPACLSFLQSHTPPMSAEAEREATAVEAVWRSKPRLAELSRASGKRSVLPEPS